jgi:hypothetical protein
MLTCIGCDVFRFAGNVPRACSNHLGFAQFDSSFNSAIRGVVDTGGSTGNSLRVDQRWRLGAGNSICNFRRCECRASVDRFRDSVANLGVILEGLSLGADVRTTVPLLDVDNNRHPNSVTALSYEC